MKERGILFSAPMVRAILEGRKVQTRRVVKMRDSARYVFRALNGLRALFDLIGPVKSGRGDKVRLWLPCFGVNCRQGKVGDRLWVRETWAAPWGKEHEIFYRADGPDHPDDGSWKPSIFMPRWASRITLEITDVRVERLQDISARDCIAEGIDLSAHKCGCERCSQEATLCPATQGSLILDYIALWDSINKSKYPWESSPFVWVITFKRIE